MPLTNTAIKAAKPKEKPYKLSDEKGLYLLINPNGNKLFRVNYRMHGKQKTLSLGKYPAISLVQARDKRDLARKQIAEGIDPMATKKLKVSYSSILPLSGSIQNT